MIQRFIYQALSQGLAAIQADPTVLDDLFADLYGLGADEVAGIKQVFARPIEVRHGYAHIDAVMPLYTVVLQGEQQSDFAMGDALGAADAAMGDPDFGAEVRGSVWEHNYQVLCYAEHPDVCTYMYEVAKQALVANGPYFLQNDVIEPILGGMDLSPETGYLPEHIFGRVLSMRCKREFVSIDRQSRLGKAFAVTGIAIPPASPNDNGGAQTLVTVTIPASQE